jgi:hypothetical protein
LKKFLISFWLIDYLILFALLTFKVKSLNSYY